MKCSDVNNQLDAYVDGELGEGARARLETHLTGCHACQTELAKVRILSHRLGAPVDAPNLRDRIRAASSDLSQEKKMKKSTMRIGFATAAILTAAVALTLAMPNKASAAWKEMAKAAVHVKTAKIIVSWATPTGAKDSKVVWCDAKRVRMDYSNGQWEVFDGKQTFGSAPDGAGGDAMGSLDPVTFRIDYQMLCLGRDGKEPFLLPSSGWKGKTFERLGIAGDENQRFVFWVDPQTHYPARMVEEVQKNGSWRWESELAYELNIPLSDDLFEVKARKP